MKKPPVLILGARSDIGKAVAYKFAAMGHPVQLAARNVLTLTGEKNDMELRHAVRVSLHEFDALAVDTHRSFVSALPITPHIVVCAVGLMGTQAESECNAHSAVRIMRSNYEGPASILGVFANHFETRGSGILIGISSVAGERGRATNYVYGSAKAGFTAFLSGLRNRLANRGVHVVTVLPGFVVTQMTEGMKLPALLTARPVEVAEAIARGAEKKQDIIYILPIWRVIMFIIRTLPERAFKKLHL